MDCSIQGDFMTYACRFRKITHVAWNMTKQDWTLFQMGVSERIMKLNEVIFTFIHVTTIIVIIGLSECLVNHTVPNQEKTMYHFQKRGNKWSNSIGVTGLISSVSLAVCVHRIISLFRKKMFSSLLNKFDEHMKNFFSHRAYWLVIKLFNSNLG